MSEGIIAALITGGLAFAGVLVTKFSGNTKLINEIKEEKDVYTFDYKYLLKLYHKVLHQSLILLSS